jgi:hypothetical protein
MEEDLMAGCGVKKVELYPPMPQTHEIWDLSAQYPGFHTDTCALGSLTPVSRNPYGHMRFGISHPSIPASIRTHALWDLSRQYPSFHMDTCALGSLTPVVPRLPYGHMRFGISHPSIPASIQTHALWDLSPQYPGFHTDTCALGSLTPVPRLPSVDVVLYSDNFCTILM